MPIIPEGIIEASKTAKTAKRASAAASQKKWRSSLDPKKRKEMDHANYLKYKKGKKGKKGKPRIRTEEDRLKARVRRRRRYAKDTEFRIKNILASSFYNHLNGRVGNYSVRGRTLEFLGISIKEFKIYLESQFSEGMTWNNQGKAAGVSEWWEIDHIRPCSSFDLTDVTQQAQCWHYLNLRPLWRSENIAKSNKWPRS